MATSTTAAGRGVAKSTIATGVDGEIDNSGNGALTSLNLASNNLGPKGAKHVAEAIKGHVSGLIDTIL